MPYLLTASPGNPTNWVKMETESILSAHSVKSSRWVIFRSKIYNSIYKATHESNYYNYISAETDQKD